MFWCVGQVGCCAKSGVISLPPLSDSNTPLPPPPRSLRLLLQNKDSRNVYCRLTCLIFMSCLIVIFMFNYNSSRQRYGNITGFIFVYSVSNMCLSDMFGVANCDISSLTVMLEVPLVRIFITTVYFSVSHLYIFLLIASSLFYIYFILIFILNI